MALSRESIEGAVGFAATYDWSVPVARVRVGWPDYGTRSFMARTPWVHVISPDGRIAATMHGADFDQLERSVRQFNSPSPEVDR